MSLVWFWSLGKTGDYFSKINTRIDSSFSFRFFILLCIGLLDPRISYRLCLFLQNHSFRSVLLDFVNALLVGSICSSVENLASFF